MTRINLIAPSELTDQHLIAEYREIFMVAGALRRTLKSQHGFQADKVSKRFCLNAGHVYFFYNKGKYLHLRYQKLVYEMKRRGFNPDRARVFPEEIFRQNGLYKNWTPQTADFQIIRKRLREKINMKPNWYRKSAARRLLR